MTGEEITTLEVVGRLPAAIADETTMTVDQVAAAVGETTTIEDQEEMLLVLRGVPLVDLKIETDDAAEVGVRTGEIQETVHMTDAKRANERDQQVIESVIHEVGISPVSTISIHTLTVH